MGAGQEQAAAVLIADGEGPSRWPEAPVPQCWRPVAFSVAYSLPCLGPPDIPISPIPGPWLLAATPLR